MVSGAALAHQYDQYPGLNDYVARGLRSQRIKFMIDDSNKSADFVSDESPHFSAEQSPQEFAAWEEIDKGRFMPRRVRGSNPGRALG